METTNKRTINEIKYGNNKNTPPYECLLWKRK